MGCLRARGLRALHGLHEEVGGEVKGKLVGIQYGEKQQPGRP